MLGSSVIRQPFFSIVIPTYNREAQLVSCLDSLARLDYPRDRFEAIVVNDGGEVPDTAVAPFSGDLNVRLLHQRHAGAGAARNAGAAQAKGEFLAFTDDDCAPDPHWLSALAKRFATVPDHLIGGRTLNVLPDNLFSTASQLLLTYLYAYYNADPDRARFFASNNMALATDRFRSAGGFDTTFTRAAAEDREFCDRWLYHSYRMMYAPEAIIHHAHALSFDTFWRQHFTYGRGAFQFRQARALRNHEHIKLEPPSFYTNLVRYPFVSSPNLRAVLLAVLLMVSQAANAAGFFWEKTKHPQHAGHET